VKVSGIETLACDAGWRNYHFVKLTTSDGIVGWSEFSEDFGSPGIGAIIAKLSAKVVGQTVSDHERIYAELYAATRPAAGGVVAQAIAAIENALLDAKAKALGVPCYALLGGKLRDRIPLYWSHCATWRINHAAYYKPEIKDLDGVKRIGREVREKGFKAAKTNIFIYEDGKNPRGWRPGFGSPYYPELNIDATVLRNLHMHLEALRDGLGPDLGLLLDLNFNAKTEGYLKILRAIADIDMFWVEIDTFDWKAQRFIRDHSPHPISGLETLVDVREFIPFMNEQSVDVAIIDLPWNGWIQGKRVADMAEAYEINIAPHNYYSHLADIISAQFCGTLPNVKIMEIDIDDVSWKSELMTVQPKIEKGYFEVPTGPGWGTAINEEVLRSHPWPAK